MASGDVPHDGHTGLMQAPGKTQGRLATELDNDAHEGATGTLRLDHLQDILEREGFEVEPVGGVVVGGYRLRIAIDHHGLVSGLAQCQRRVHTGIVELDALTDPIRSLAKNDDLGGIAGLDLGLRVVRRVVIRRSRDKLGRARVHGLENGPDAHRMSSCAHIPLG